MWSGPDGYLRPDQFLDHLMVIKTVTLVRALTLGLVVPLTMFDYMSNEQLQTLAEMGRYCHLTFKWAYAKIAKSKCHGHIITKKLISSKLSMGLIPKI